jgi:hypothetical protein
MMISALLRGKDGMIFFTHDIGATAPDKVVAS